MKQFLSDLLCFVVAIITIPIQFMIMEIWLLLLIIVDFIKSLWMEIRNSNRGKMSNDLSARVIEVYFFYRKYVGREFETSSYYNTLEEAIQEREVSLKNSDFEDVSPVIKGYI